MASDTSVVMQGLGDVMKQVFLRPHYDCGYGRILSIFWVLTMSSAAVKRADLFVEFTKVQAGSQTAIQRFQRTDFWRGRRMMLLVILKTAFAVVIQEFAAGRLKILWRKVVTASAIRRYLAEDNNFYHLKLDGTVDNPDHRITNDVQTIVDYIVDISKVLPEHAWKFFGLTALMWQTSPVACLILWLYAVLGTALTRNGFERNLATREAVTQSIEAHLRFALVRIAECAEGIAFHRAGGAERDRLLASQDRLVKAQCGLLNWTSAFQAFQEVYGRVATMLPSLITAPLFWQGRIEFGAISKLFTSFRSVKEILLFVASNYDRLASVRARLERLEKLRDFQERCRRNYDDASSSTSGPFKLRMYESSGDQLLVLKNVRILIPWNGSAGAAWLGGDSGVSVELGRGGSLLIQGESGVGKSSLLRVIAGLWNEGAGDVYKTQKIYFVPQTPYLPTGFSGASSKLRDQLLYPDSKVPDAVLLEALKATDLEFLAESLCVERDWATALSGGERQRVVFARLLVQIGHVDTPLVLLDEATSACSENMEARMYSALSSRLKTSGGAFVSVGHRSSLKRYHDTHIEMQS